MCQGSEVAACAPKTHQALASISVIVSVRCARARSDCDFLRFLRFVLSELNCACFARWRPHSTGFNYRAVIRFRSNRNTTALRTLHGHVRLWRHDLLHACVVSHVCFCCFWHGTGSRTMDLLHVCAFPSSDVRDMQVPRWKLTPHCFVLVTFELHH